MSSDSPATPRYQDEWDLVRLAASDWSASVIEAWLRLLKKAQLARTTGGTLPTLTERPESINAGVASLGMLHPEIGRDSWETVPQNQFYPRTLSQSYLVIRYWYYFAMWTAEVGKIQTFHPSAQVVLAGVAAGHPIRGTQLVQGTNGYALPGPPDDESAFFVGLLLGRLGPLFQEPKAEKGKALRTLERMLDGAHKGGKVSGESRRKRAPDWAEVRARFDKENVARAKSGNAPVTLGEWAIRERSRSPLLSNKAISTIKRMLNLHSPAKRNKGPSITE